MTQVSFVFVGLGNPGEEYEGTRHNTGRLALDYFCRREKWPDWQEDKKTTSLVTEGKLGKTSIKLILPETMMNRSGLSVSRFIKSKAAAASLVVIHDDLDLPLGLFKLSFGRGSGGHRGVESIIKNLKTRDFIRLRVGIAATTPNGKVKKLAGEAKAIDFILGKFTTAQTAKLKKLWPKITQALEVIATQGRFAAMNKFN